MDRLNEFINDLLSERGITKDDKEDLKIELLDHIILLKQEYIEKGYDEEEAIELALKNFGDINEIGNGIKRTLPSRNKYNDFSKLEISKTVLFMLVGYFLTVFYIVSLGEMNYESLLYNVILSSIPIVIGFAYINLKLTIKIKRIKNLLISLTIFFLCEKVLMLLIYGVAYGVFSNRAVNFIDLLDFKFIVTFLILGLISIVLTNFISDKVASKIRNPYNAKITSNLLWILSVALMLLYYLFPNRWYLLSRFVESIINNEVVHVSKNILFLTINHKIALPNIGLIILIIMGVKLLKQINKKGIESLF
ncbi:MAG: hypothetical protein KIC47_15470 [Clostridium sp.]|uniref:permease prefix domain 1-containing protein n=1 Tax=Clostridium sp. TaxID=1506 RepID=UPI001D90EE33|nr:permease prefix domain 1-containing protein [Clostridium sp.]MBS5938766.1 hypothetical protein [Clostridium sp.]MBS5951687.1 hypothetical protein [Clostridium sp.]